MVSRRWTSLEVVARIPSAGFLGPLLILAALTAHPALGADGSRVAEAQFRAANPCPVTGKAQGPCAGYVVDRVIPLVCGGADHPDNMRWLTVAEAKAKAKWERIGCRPGRRLVLPHEMKSMTEAFALDDTGQVQSRQLGAGERGTTAAIIEAPPEPSAPPPATEPEEPEEQEPHE
jgi:hypothetical protein